MEDEKKYTVRGSILKLLGIGIFAVVCLYAGRQFMEKEPSTLPIEIKKQEDMIVFDIKMAVVNIEQGSDNYTEITTLGTPELVSNRPGNCVAMENTSKAIELMQKLLPENLTFILVTSKGTSILKCTDIKEGSAPNRLNFAFQQNEGNLQGIINAYKEENKIIDNAPTKNPSGVLMALSYAGFKKEDQNKEVPYPLHDRVNYLLTPCQVTLKKEEASHKESPSKDQLFSWSLSLKGVDKIRVVGIKGQEGEIGEEEFATKTWDSGTDNFLNTPPNGNFEAEGKNGENHFFALKFSHPLFEKDQNVLTFETEFLEDSQGQKVIPSVCDSGSFASANKDGVVVMIDDRKDRAVI